MFPFPGTLPNGSASVADGSFPNVFNNETPDASFGITSPIFIDQLTPTGASTGVSINVTNLVQTQLGANLTTSFPSKSELGLSLTPDGTALTFMGYGAAANQLDVSNSNTPGHIDITNPINSQGVLSNQRDIAELSYQGNIQLTTTNAYSGNNGRNVVLGSNGNYYMVGNAGNNGKSLSFTSGAVTIASGSDEVTLSGSGKNTTANMYVGAPVSGTNIPTGAYVTSIVDQTHFLINANATGTASGAYVANEGAFQLTGVSFSNTSSTVTVADTSKLAAGMPLTGTNFAANSYIQSITDATHFVVNTLPTGSATGSSYVAAVSNSMLSDNTGVQMITKGTNDTTGSNVAAVTNSTAVGKVNGTYGSATGYQRGFTLSQVPGQTDDKSGKDNNYRGLTDYNNAVYVTKGSGGNGLDAVYQVNPNGGGYVAPGSSAGLATSATAGTASINPLPGWPTTSTGANEGATNGSTVYHPFGIWFANDTTLYVGDEGLAGSTNAAAGGLQKWSWNGTSQQWMLDYTLAASTIASYAVGGIGTLQAEGLRNITGKVNGDGTVTIYGITSTTGQTLNDEGADPNQLVSITDTLSTTSLPTGENFDVLETAADGDVLRGVSFAPSAVPEPGSMTLLFAGVALLGGYRRRRQA
ncbi:protein of unknown function DUF1555 [Chthoniobacter flavus Ellin428]|uniref:Ice-binding protein C-terminal domain-containing protein n=1 Tax=Chthoniobacter flavus Ellin428 TaxID=497964 RepID=B4DBL2_9BACT|nr:PEP-CTERM sorting domain-containing protein [Chthoniobacter flavus]EDY16199.1 protein of unknown function DUF1555 [Chthoniobacter flavus Ellin428]